MRVQTVLHPGRRLGLLVTVVVTLLMGLAWQGTAENVTAIANPAVFTVVQSPAGPATVQPGDDVTYTINFTAGGDTTYLNFDGNLGANLQVTSFTGGLGPASCTGMGTSSFTCNIGALGNGSAIESIVVHSAVVNVADGTTIDLGTEAFVARNGGEPGTNPAADNAGALTVANELIAVTNTVSPTSVFEGNLVTHTIVLTNNGTGASGTYSASVAITNGTVINVVCPGGPGTGQLTATASCTGQPSLASAGGTGTITVTTRANDGAASTALSNVLTLSSGAHLFTSPGSQMSPVVTASVNQLTIQPSSVAVTTGTSVTVCTLNTAGSGTQVAGSNSGLNPLALNDFTLVAGGGASVASVSSASTPDCTTGESGVKFTSNSDGTIAVTARYNKATSFEATSNTVTITFSQASNPNPTLSSISPLTANAGGSGFTLTVAGSGFVNGITRVQWDGSDRTTTCSSATTCTAAITATDIASAGSVAVRISNPLPGGGTSNPVNFTVNAAPNPVPALTNVTPNTAVAGAAAMTVTVTGTNFVANSIVRWGTTDLVTSMTDATHLSATIPANLLTTPGTTQIKVFNPTPGGGPSVQQIAFTVNSGATKLAFTTQPSGAVVNTAFSTQPVVTVQNAGSATVTVDSTTVVTLALVGGGGSAHLVCTGGLSKTVTNGVAAFAGCSVDTVATGYTLTASATSLTSATSSTFDITAAPPTSTAQLAVVVPAVGAKVARSRLTFSATTGTISPAPAKVSFVIKRKSDNKYWDASASNWVVNVVVNDGTAGTSPGEPWTLAVAGPARRLFVNTTVVVEARAVSGDTSYVSQATPEIAIR